MKTIQKSQKPNRQLTTKQQTKISFFNEQPQTNNKSETVTEKKNIRAART